MPRVSLVVPVYNAFKTIGYCLDHILTQTYQDFEIILINDGSRDNSQEILNSYKNKYSDKIRVYSQKNSGIARTRNKGIKLSKGKYLFFIDNDDYIEKDYIEKFVNRIEETDSELVIGGYKRVDINNNKILFTRNTSDNPWTKYMFLAPWGRVYKRESLIRNHLKFLDINIGEDVYLNILANLKLKVITLDYKGYNWVYNDLSVSNTKQRTIGGLVSIIPFLSKMNEDIRDIDIPNKEKILLEYFFIKTSIYYILHAGRKTDSNQLITEAEKIFMWLDEKYPFYMRNPHIGIFTPKGEHISTRSIIYIYIILKKLKLEKLFLRIYSVI